MQEYWKSLSPVNKAKFILSILIGIIGVVFATLNWESQEVHLLFKKTEIPTTMVIILSGVIGYAISYIFNIRKFRAKDKEIDLLNSEIESLKRKLEE